ncbi:hypothetical protein LC1981_0468 [Lacticaseibacillus paracasei NRIC 1981]|nr:hypothetical protein LC1981_0468 [Lacticaseibacillus paracasei NRIC 1981]
MTDSRRLNVRLSSEISNYLDLQSERFGLTRSAYITMLLVQDKQSHDKNDFDLPKASESNLN